MRCEKCTGVICEKCGLHFRGQRIDYTICKSDVCRCDMGEEVLIRVIGEDLPITEIPAPTGDGTIFVTEEPPVGDQVGQ